MTSPHRPGVGRALCLAGLTAALAAVLYGGARTPGGVWLWQPLAETAPAPDFEGELQVFKARMAVKQDVIRELVAGKSTLLEAAGQFHLLDSIPPECIWRPAQVFSSECGEEERCCYAVISWVQAFLENEDPCQSEPVVRQLLAEMESLRQQGGLKLPAPGPSCLARFEAHKRSLAR
jgi:hypothetical protein